MRSQSTTRAKDIMKPNPVIISPETTLREAAEKMDSMNCGMLPVGTADSLEGVITDRDIIVRAVARGKNVATEVVRDYMTPGVCICNQEDTTETLGTLMRDNQVSRLIVEDDDGKVCGVITFGRILREDDNMSDITEVIECAVGKKAA